MSLKKRLLLIACCLVCAASLVAWLALQHVSVGLMDQWGGRLLESHLQHERTRIQQRLNDQRDLVQQAAASLVAGELPSRWSPNGHTALKPLWEGDLIARLEGQDYRLAVLGTNEVYAREAHTPAAEPLKHQVWDSSDPVARWLKHLSLERDSIYWRILTGPSEGDTQLWVAVPVQQGEFSGFLALGISFDTLSDPQNAAQEDESYLAHFFIDHQSEHILWQEAPSRVERSLNASGSLQANTLMLLIDDPWARQHILSMQQQLASSVPALDLSLIRKLSIHDRRYLVGLLYVPELDGYGMTLLDLEALLPVQRMVPVVVVFGLALVVSLLLLHAVLCHLLLNPLAILERAMAQVRLGNGNASNQEDLVAEHSAGDVRRLIQHFSSIAVSMQQANQVAQRTEALEQLVRIDPLTGLLNRRGMHERLESEFERARRLGHQFAILWLDVDHFKEINDALGHAKGDQALECISEVLRQSVRSYDCAARWGGDEFLVLLAPSNAAALARIAERIRVLVTQSAFERPLSVSIGTYLTQSSDTLEAALQCADEALYAAKEAGRNALRHYSDLSHTSYL